MNENNKISSPYTNFVNDKKPNNQLQKMGEVIAKEAGQNPNDVINNPKSN